ncbi:MAG: menH [Planctomycetota bacterium]|nr:menH [Planctomycetota bacterium]
MSFEESVIFHPQRDEGDGPTSSRVSAEDVWFSTPDQIRLNGRFAEAERPRAIVLFAEGNAGNIASRDWVLRLFRDKLGASVLIFDYRGYGRSEGIPSEAGVLSDARAARRWLAQRTGVAEGEIVLVGESLGGAVMVDLAAKDGAGGLILQNTFSSLPDVASSHLPLLPVRFLMTTRLDSARKIAQYHGPLLQTHGDADRVVPFALGRRLFDAANEPKRFVRVSGGDHNDPPSREFLDALDEFLGLLPSPETSRRVQ